MCIGRAVSHVSQLGGVLHCMCHAGADLLLVGGKLDVKDDDAVDPGLNVFDGIQFLLCSMISQAKHRVEMHNEMLHGNVW